MSKIQIDGVMYKMVSKEVEEGDQVFILNSEECPEAIGKVGEVLETYDYGFIDFDINIPSEEYGDITYIDGASDSFCVVEPIKETHGEAKVFLDVDGEMKEIGTTKSWEISKSVTSEDILRERVDKLERKLAEVEAQTTMNARNIETFAEEMTETTYLAKRNEQDIADLDERTQPEEGRSTSVTLDGVEIARAVIDESRRKERIYGRCCRGCCK